MLETLAEMLGRRYVIAATASCGASAVAEVVEAHPDIVVLDISLGDMTGFDVARRLKKSGSTAKIIFLSVHENRDFVRAAFDVGASGYVFKSQISLDLLQRAGCGFKRGTLRSRRLDDSERLDAVALPESSFAKPYYRKF